MFTRLVRRELLNFHISHVHEGINCKLKATLSHDLFYFTVLLLVDQADRVARTRAAYARPSFARLGQAHLSAMVNDFGTSTAYSFPTLHLFSSTKCFELLVMSDESNTIPLLICRSGWYESDTICNRVSTFCFQLFLIFLTGLLTGVHSENSS